MLILAPLAHLQSPNKDLLNARLQGLTRPALITKVSSKRDSNKSDIVEHGLGKREKREKVLGLRHGI